MRSIHQRVAVGVAVTSVAVGVVVAPSVASAATYDGVLGIHGPGSVFAGTSGPGIQNKVLVTQVTAAGAVATFPAEVLNRGTALAQFRVKLSTTGEFGVSLTAGTLNVTSLATSSQGYVTNALAPGKAQALTLKVTSPLGALPTSAYYAALSLYSVDGSIGFGNVYAGAVVKSTTGTSTDDIYITNGSQPMVGVTTPNTSNGWVNASTAPTIKVGGTATFAITLKNGATTTQAMKMYCSNASQPCQAGDFAVTFKYGTVDITSLVETPNGWVTPVLAPGRSAKVTLTVKALALPSALDPSCYDNWLENPTANNVDVNHNDPHTVFASVNVV
jgi:hypothetical protein